MAIVSPRHFVTPCLNKTHLFTMLGIILLFVAFRISGGAMKTNVNKESNEEESVVDTAGEQNNNITHKQVVSAEDETVQKALDTSAQAEGNPEPQPESGKKAEPKKDGGSLDDIERAMGLR